MSAFFKKKDLIYTVYQEKSFSKAAQKLYISQPALSAVIKKLEDDIGMPLFDRSSKPIRMTEAGMEYIKAAEVIRNAEDVFARYVDAANARQAGVLALGCNQLFSSLVLPRYVSEFIALYPQVKLRLVDDNSTVLKNMICSGQLDLIIDNQYLDPEMFEHKPLFTESLLLAVPGTFACNRGLEAYRMTAEDIICDRHCSQQMAAVPLEHFADVPFVSMTSDNDTRIRTDHIFRGVPGKPRTVLEIDRLVNLYSFVEMGTAASVVSDTLVKNFRHQNEDVVFYKLGSSHAKREIHVSYKRNRYYSKAMESFIDLVVDKNEAQSG